VKLWKGDELEPERTNTGFFLPPSYPFSWSMFLALLGAQFLEMNLFKWYLKIFQADVHEKVRELLRSSRQAGIGLSSKAVATCYVSLVTMAALIIITLCQFFFRSL
jgi:hypothetical protein